MTLTPDTRLGPYRILAPLDAGGMGKVYRAHDTRSGATSPSRCCPAPDLRRVNCGALPTRQVLR